MRPLLKGAVLALAGVVLLSVLTGAVFLKATGLTARATPGPIETALARAVRTWAIPREYRARPNPVLRNAESIRSGLEHFADHCASCHANDGSGETQIGRALFPPAPDMRARATQDLTDGQLFYIIEHGVRFTGMPAWSTGSIEGEEASWHLVNFIRHLPELSEAEFAAMKEMNPTPPSEVIQRLEEERFLAGLPPLRP